MELIGRGEEVAVKILHDLFPKAKIETQVPLHKLLSHEWRIELSERQLKESIDIVVKRKHRKPLCVRIQDKHHNTVRFSNIDGAQKFMLEHSRCDVVDIPEIECPHLFKNRYNSVSMAELHYYIKSYR